MTGRRGRGHDRKGRSKHDGQYVNVPYKMIHSLAFRSLNGAALKVFFELRSRFNGSNNGQLHLSQQEAAKFLGMSKSTAQRAFDELELEGFIAKTRQGMFYRGLASEWRVTDQRYNGEPATRDWEAWRPDTDGTRSKPNRPKREHRPVAEPIIALINPPEYRGPRH